MKLFEIISGDLFCIINLRLPQAEGSQFHICLAGMIPGHGYGWFFSARFNDGETFSRRYYLTPGQWVGLHLKRLQALKIWLNPFPVYGGWRNYWMVDHVESWGVKRFSCGAAYLRWANDQFAQQDENRFSCWLADRSDYEEHLKLVEDELQSGYRRTSRDHGLEQFEERGY